MGRKPARALALLAAICSATSHDVRGQAPDSRQQIQDLSRRIEELERSIEDLSVGEAEERESVSAFFSDWLTFGGFFETSLTTISGPDTDTQAAASMHTLGFNVTARFSEDFRFASQFLTTLYFQPLNFDNNPRAAALGYPGSRAFGPLATSIVPAQGYVEYFGSDAFKLQAGIGYVPFGIAHQQRELVLFVRRGGPFLLRMTELVTPLWAGVHAHGSGSGALGRAGYNVYTYSPFDHPRVLGAGTRLWWSPSDERILAGASLQAENRGGATTPAVGADFSLRLGPFSVISEFARRYTPEDEPWSAYVEPHFEVLDEKLLFFVFGDYGENPFAHLSAGATELDDPHSRWEYGAGVNWLPTSFTRFRATVYFLDYVGSTAVIDGQDRDFTAFDLSAGVAF